MHEFDTPVVSNEPGVLLLMLAAVVAVLGLQVALSHARQARRASQRRGSASAVIGGGRWPWLLPLLLAALGFGSAVSAAMVLAISAMAPLFDLGYQPLLATALWLAAPLAALPGLALLTWRPLRGSVPLAALALATAAIAVQAGWLLAPRFEPGLLWQPGWLLAAAAVLLAAMLLALLLAFGAGGNRGAWRRLWRFGAALLGGAGLALGQAAVIEGGLLSAQTGAAERASWSATTLCTIAGALVPVLLAALLLWQRLGQAERRLHQQRHRHRLAVMGAEADLSEPGSTLPPDTPAPAPRRRKRRQRHRTL